MLMNYFNSSFAKYFTTNQSKEWRFFYKLYYVPRFSPHGTFKDRTRYNMLNGYCDLFTF